MLRFISNDAADIAEIIEEQGGLEQTVHVFESRDIDAVNGALAARRPLLVRGEPGIGKSQLARAAAQLLGRAFVCFTVDNRTESHDLMWHFDAIARLAEAQVQGVMGVKDSEALRQNLDMSRFITPGPLWWAMSWRTAAEQLERAACNHDGGGKEDDCGGAGGIAGRCIVHAPDEWTQEDGVVVLIDEIDKADASVPNGLLECLGNRSFTCCNGRRVGFENGTVPLVVVTTNEERALPDPFLRRCVVLQLFLPELPKKRDVFLKRLEKLGRAHDNASKLDDTVLKSAAALLADDRMEMMDRGLSPPGCAEYLDLLAALKALSGQNGDSPEEMLIRLRQFIYKKHPAGRI